MSKRIVAGIDIGTAKVTTIVASISEQGTVHVMGVATNASKGIKKGQIVDIEEATGTISESLEAAERMAGYSISRAYFSVGGAHISSQNSHGVVAVADPQKEITSEDIKRAVEAASAVSMASTREILHVLPRAFIVDSQDGIKDPVGMTGVRLEVSTHLITVNTTGVKNLEKCASVVGVDVDGFVFNGLASSLSVLSETEKELGVVMADIGGGTISVCIFVDGALSHSAILPIGARNITNDLAIGLRISLESAEKIKLFLNKKPSEVAMPSSHEEGATKRPRRDDAHDEIDITSLHLPEGLEKVSRRMVVEGIIKPRLNEMFSMIAHEIKKSGYGGMTPAGIVLCGGGAETMGLVETARRNLAMQARIGMPGGITGLIDEITTPGYATSVGLVLYGARQGGVLKESFGMDSFGKYIGKLPVQGMAEKVVDFIKSFLP